MTLEITGNTIFGTSGVFQHGVYSFYKENGYYRRTAVTLKHWDIYTSDNQGKGEIQFYSNSHARIRGEGIRNSNSFNDAMMTTNKDLKGKDFFASCVYGGMVIDRGGSYEAQLFSVYLMKGSTQQITLLHDNYLIDAATGAKTGGGMWIRGWWTGTVLNYIYCFQAGDNNSIVNSGTLDFGTDTCGLRFRINKYQGSNAVEGYMHIPPIIIMPYDNNINEI